MYVTERQKNNIAKRPSKILLKQELEIKRLVADSRELTLHDIDTAQRSSPEMDGSSNHPLSMLHSHAGSGVKLPAVISKDLKLDESRGVDQTRSGVGSPMALGAMMASRRVMQASKLLGNRFVARNRRNWSTLADPSLAAFPSMQPSPMNMTLTNPEQTRSVLSEEGSQQMY